MSYIYVAPSISCDKCWEFIRLPYPDIPQISADQWSEGVYEGPMDTVQDEWTALFGCRQCGQVAVYDGISVGEHQQVRANLSKFHAEANCFSVDMQCAQTNCKAPARLHVDMRDNEEAKHLVSLLRSGFFHGLLPCGHHLMQIPEKYYRDVHRVLTRLW